MSNNELTGEIFTALSSGEKKLSELSEILGFDCKKAIQEKSSHFYSAIMSMASTHGLDIAVDMETGERILFLKQTQND